MIKIQSALHGDMQLTQGLNSGSGISIDDITIDEAMTFVARKITPWKGQRHVDNETGLVSDTRNEPARGNGQR